MISDFGIRAPRQHTVIEPICLLQEAIDSGITQIGRHSTTAVKNDSAHTRVYTPCKFLALICSLGVWVPLIIPSPIGKHSIVMTVFVCLYIRVFVCFSIRKHIFGSTRPTFTNVLCMLPIAVARSSSGSVAIRYVLPFYGWRHICS